MPARRLPLALVAVAAATGLLVTGCGGTAGQASALEACKAYTNGTSGVETAAQRSAALSSAEHWARQAAAKAAVWQPLVNALRDYARATTPAGTPVAGAQQVAATAHDVINTSCETAAKGF